MDYFCGSWAARLMLLVLLCACAVFADAKDNTLSGYIGSHKKDFSISATCAPASPQHQAKKGFLAITEVFPDIPGSAEYHYAISAPGIDYERIRRGIGFGPETFFIRAHQPVKSLSIKSASPDSAPLFSSSGWWVVTQAELDKLLVNDSFRIMALLHSGDPNSERLVKILAEDILKAEPRHHISTGFSAEIKFANRPAEKVAKEIENCRNWSLKYKLPAMLGMVSWWSGTPVNISDGKGGVFGDMQYQQICYSPKVQHPEDKALKALIGDRYDNHYCLSVPNQWSNTPWLTMNSKPLNDYRYKRLDEAVALIKDMSNNDLTWIDSLFLENEPRYWDTHCEDGNHGRKLGELWADFNPLAIEAAKKDGVDLNPADGLSDDEFAWLFRNVGKYNQECVDAINKSLSKHGISLPVYTHSLQHRNMFPGIQIGHPASEWAYAQNARAGLEGMWSHPSDFARIRDWGRWSNLNREEGDGLHIDIHLWDLRVCYMMGGDLYNSYNWDAIGTERVVDYINEFIKHLPIVTMPPAEVNRVSESAFTMNTPMKLQAFTALTLPLKSQKSGLASLRINGADGRIMASSNTQIAKGDQQATFEFATPVELHYDHTATISVTAVDEQKNAIDLKIGFAGDADHGIELSLDLRTQRALSLAAIARAQAARSSNR
ncbi:MAG: hypothetical protein GX139_13090 [Armatimonadetes bacterium]|jgi:hypothetical protein|nr:hypothetical protein [Armatimonadota bacterium]